MISHFGQSDAFTQVSMIINCECSAVFIFLMAFKLVGLRSYFFLEWINIVDLVLVSLFDFVVVIDTAVGYNKYGIIPVFVGRLIRLWRTYVYLLNFQFFHKVCLFIYLFIKGFFVLVQLFNISTYHINCIWHHRRYTNSWKVFPNRHKLHPSVLHVLSLLHSLSLFFLLLCTLLISGKQIYMLTG